MNTDRMTVRIVTFTLAIVVVGGVAAMAGMAVTHTPIPDQIDRVVSIALGAIAGLLAKTSSDSAAQDVQVVNQPDQPVPVDQSNQQT